MPKLVVEIDIFLIRADIEVGIWCNDCLLPAVVRTPYIIAERNTLHVMGRGVATRRTNCGATP